MQKIAILVLLAATACFAQGTSASFSGRVVDPRGTPIKNATVYACTHSDACIENPAVSDSAGRFVFTSLPPGGYELKLKKAGYYETRFGRIKVRAGQNTGKRFKVKLETCCVDYEHFPEGSYVDTRSSEVKTIQRSSDLQSIPHERNIGGILALP